MPVVHPLDSTLFFPYVKDDLSSPEEMIDKLVTEYMEGKQEYDPKTLILTRLYEDSYLIDSISSHFTEEVRVPCHQNDKPSYIDVWRTFTPDKIRSFKTTDDLRMALAKAGGAECAFFSPALCLRLYLDFGPSRAPVKVIDPSAGWGDRMIAAIAAGDGVISYDGYDPNPDLKEPFRKIMSTLDKTNKCRFFCEPFEKASVQVGYYDLGITSPPYFDLEVYENKDIPSKQSIKENSTYDAWVDRFYIQYLTNLRKSIRPGGRIIIYVSKYYNRKGHLIDLEKTTIDILTKKIQGVTLFSKGFLKTKRMGGFPRPFFIFDVNT